MSGTDSELRLSHVAAALAVGLGFFLQQLVVRRRPRAAAAPAGAAVRVLPPWAGPPVRRS